MKAISEFDAKEQAVYKYSTVSNNISLSENSGNIKRRSYHKARIKIAHDMLHILHFDAISSLTYICNHLIVSFFLTEIGTEIQPVIASCLE